MVTDRAQWIEWLDRIAEPVVAAMAEGRLTSSLPTWEARSDRSAFAANEAFCRTFTGIAPWLELQGLTGEEGTLQASYRNRIRAALKIGVTADSPDRFPFDVPRQSLVEAGFLCHGLLRAPSVWASLDDEIKGRMLDALRSSRDITPGFNNWLLFSATVEAFFASVGESYDAMRIEFAVRQHDQWYKGDGAFGDGPYLHHDYYNSFVIQPMLIDVLSVLEKVNDKPHPLTEDATRWFKRYAAVQERMISPEGTYPPIGRSLAYRFGAFQHLSQAALQDRLPEEIEPAQVREALSAVIRRSLQAPNTFDEQGWLNPGVAGHQPGLAERYISRGSPYLCCAVFLPLGLSGNAPFWQDPPTDWTAKRIWSGEDVPCDHAIGR